MRARLLAYAVVVGVLAGPAVAAPVPRSLKKPAAPIVLTLALDDQLPDGIRVTLTNNTTDDVSWESSTIPLARVGIDIDDENGNRLPITHPCAMHSPSSPANAYTVKPGERYEMRFTLASCFPNGGRPEGKLSVLVAFTYGGTMYLSEPLEVK